MATLEKPEMPILRETPDQIYQRIANRMADLARQRGETPPATDEGELFYDLLYPIAAEISEQQQLLEYAFLQGFLPWADGEYLDAHGYLLGLPRNTNETDDAYRERLLIRARTEEGNGRRSDYERWARNVDGVGGAIAVEKERHDVSIDVYITDTAGQPVTESFAKQVRTAMEDVRIAGHDLQVHPAEIFPVTVSVRLILRKDVVASEVIAAITNRINDYLKGRSAILYKLIGALFLVDGVEDYDDYLLNGGTENLEKPLKAVPVLILEAIT
ncbi:hypothetical protein I532_01435 [Brevibacillus borstelensis AK1]|uniref:Uncharacterized protein n=2 Tax=Bacillati TaxID=1783272 RepID=M8DL62_9BACL|nr:baseplate J/gp47 family protein [Brevibacillus borstelensis]EMT54227.1 hypothetical protein I532_01435 [Brevibacillus borstelensis AK1]